MTPPLSLVVGLSVAVAAAYVLTPVAIRLADRWEFYDRPAGYKGHASPTPYLGGLAVISAFVLAAAVSAGHADRTLPLIAGVILMCALGTIDDRWSLSPGSRVAVEAVLATALWAIGLGWNLGLGGGVDLVLTIVWIVAVVNAFNLFDNMDGAAGTMAAVASGAVAVLGVATDNVWLAAMGAALCGACVGFLPHNLSTPARIFLGDGGSMPVGFAVACLVMIGTSDAAAEWQALASGLLIVGIPALDTALVVISRSRRGISILTGGRDHLTHRTRLWLRNARAVAIALGTAQAVLAVLAIAAVESGPSLLVAVVGLYLLAAGTAIVALDATYESRQDELTVRAVVERPSLRSRLPFVPVVAPLAFLLGLSPFWGGYYDSRIWAPAGAIAIVLLIAAYTANPVRLGRPALTALAALAALSAWALASTAWASAREDAIVTGNRLVVLTAMLALLLVLVRDVRRATWAMGAAVAGTAVVAGYLLYRLAFGKGVELFVLGRLHEPLEYINGQGSAFVLATFPALILAARRGSPAINAAGAALAVVFASMALLSQSRGVALAAAAGTLVYLLVGQGRLRRAGVFAIVAAAVAAAGPAVFDVYQASAAAALDESVVQRAGRAILGAAVAVAVVIAVCRWLEERMPVARRMVVRRAWAVTLGVAAVGVLAVSAASIGAISERVQQQYDAFVHEGEPSGRENPTTRLASGAGNRYGYWKIAVDVWRSDPVVGVGAGGYAIPYFEHRDTLEDVRQPHSAELQVLAELGIVGTLLLLTFLGSVVWGLVRATRERSRSREPLLAIAGAAMFAAWVTHTSVDWLHLLPGVTGVALVGVAAALGPQARPARQPAVRGGRSMTPAFVVGAVLAVVTAVSALTMLSRQALVEHYARSAQQALATDPARALELSNNATRLDRDMMQPYYVRAASLARFGDGRRAAATLEAALRREPSNFVTWALLGDLRVRMGDEARAKAAYTEASRLNPRDPELARSAAGR